MDDKESFVNLNIPVINIAENNENKNYIIYTNEKDYVIVKALTAHDALEKQNIISPYKIVIPNDKNKFIMDSYKKQP